MKVLINGKVYEATDTPIIVLLNDKDKANLKGFPEDADYYLCFPDHLSFEESLKELLPNQKEKPSQKNIKELLKRVFKL